MFKSLNKMLLGEGADKIEPESMQPTKRNVVFAKEELSLSLIIQLHDSCRLQPTLRMSVALRSL